MNDEVINALSKVKTNKIRKSQKKDHNSISFRIVREKFEKLKFLSKSQNVTIQFIFSAFANAYIENQTAALEIIEKSKQKQDENKKPKNKSRSFKLSKADLAEIYSFSPLNNKND